MLWGLAYLHHDRKLHRDIKPSNILVNKKGEVSATVPVTVIFETASSETQLCMYVRQCKKCCSHVLLLCSCTAVFKYWLRLSAAMLRKR